MNRVILNTRNFKRYIIIFQKDYYYSIMLFKKQSTVHLTNKVEVSVIDKLNIATPKTPWQSIMVVSIFTFCTAAQFTLYFSSLWPFLQIVSLIIFKYLFITFQLFSLIILHRKRFMV